MKRIHIISLLISVLWISSCNKCSESCINGEVSLRENADSINFSDFKIVQLSYDAPIGSIDKLTVSDSMIFINSDNALYSFDLCGNFVAKYGTNGRASNEYLYTTAFYIDTLSKQVCIIDATQEKLLYFNYSGTFLKKERLEGLSKKFLYNAQILTDNQLLLQNRIYDSIGILFSLYDFNDGSYKDFRPVSISTDHVADMCGENMFSVYNGTISYLMPFEPCIYYYENSTEVVRFQFENVGKVLSKRKQKGIKDYSIFKSLELLNNGVFVGFSGIYETNNHILLNELTDYRYCILDKNTNCLKRYKYSIGNDDDECRHLPLVSIKCTFGDWYVGIASSMKLLQYQDIEFVGDDKNLLELESVIESASFESNPVILFYKIESI